MPIIQTGASQGLQDFTIHCLDSSGERVSICVPYEVVDRLERPGNFSVGARLERHIDEIMDAAKRAYKAGEMRNRMVYLCMDDFPAKAAWMDNDRAPTS
jgi:hypothetical protein